MLGDLVDGVLELDSRILRTLADLSLAPGAVCRDYIGGRRVAYLNPFAYALACLVTLLLVRAGLDHLHGSPAGDGLIARWGELIQFVALPIVALLLVPLFSSARRRLRWIEHYVVTLYGFGHLWLISALLWPLSERLDFPGWVGQLIPVVYLSWVFTGVYGSRWWTAALRTLVLWFATVMITLSVEAFVAPEVALLPRLFTGG